MSFSVYIRAAWFVPESHGYSLRHLRNAGASRPKRYCGASHARDALVLVSCHREQLADSHGVWDSFGRTALWVYLRCAVARKSRREVSMAIVGRGTFDEGSSMARQHPK